MIRQAKFNLILQLANFLGPLASIPVAVGFFGLEEWGEAAYGTLIASTFAFVANYGILTSGNRMLSGCCHKDRRRIFVELSSFQFYVTILSLILYVVYCEFYKISMGVYLPLSLIIVANAFDYSWYYYSIEKYKELAFVVSCTRIIFALISIACVLVIKEMWAFLLSQSMCVICINFLCIKKFDIKIKPNVKFFGVDAYLKYVRKLSPIFFVQLTSVLYSSSDRLIVKSYLGYAELGLYDLLLKYLASVTMVAIALRPILISFVAKNKSNIDILKASLTKSACLVLSITTLIYLVTCLYMPHAVLIVFPKLTAINNSFQIIILLMCSVVITSGIGDVFVNQVMLAMEKDRQFTVILLSMFIMIVFGNLYAIPEYGLLGAATVTACAHVFILVPQWFVVNKYFDVKILLSTINKLLVICAIVVAINLIASHFIPMNLVSLSLSAIITTLVFMFYVTRKSFSGKFM